MRYLVLMLAAALPAAAQIWGGSGNPWKTVTGSGSSVALNLKQSTVQRITLTAATTAVTVSGLAETEGKHGSFLICQDAAGGRAVSWPSELASAPKIDTMPGACTVVAYIVSNSRLWLVTSAANSANIDNPPPSVAVAPWADATWRFREGANLTDEDGGMMLASPAGATSGLHGIQIPVSAGLGITDPWTVTVALKISSGDLSATGENLVVLYVERGYTSYACSYGHLATGWVANFEEFSDLGAYRRPMVSLSATPPDGSVRWMRLQNDGSNVKCYISQNPTTWGLPVGQVASTEHAGTFYANAHVWGVGLWTPSGAAAQAHIKIFKVTVP